MITLPNAVRNFIIWYTKNTGSVQGNVRFYKGIHYFTDRNETPDKDNGGIVDLWNVYINEMTGV